MSLGQQISSRKKCGCERAGDPLCLFFIHLGTRRVIITSCTSRPGYAWVAQQARNFSMVLGQSGAKPCRFLIHDRDTCFLPLDAVLRAEGIEAMRTQAKTSQCNGYAERFVREARETLDGLLNHYYAEKKAA